LLAGISIFDRRHGEALARKLKNAPPHRTALAGKPRASLWHGSRLAGELPHEAHR
jgi:hypothetical protein